MDIEARDPTDIDELRRRARGEKQAEQRDRYRAVQLAIEGHQTKTIQQRTGRSRGFVQRWAYAYRDGGVQALRPQKRGGSKPKLDGPAMQQFLQRFKNGPTPEADGNRCTLRGKDAQRILKLEFGVAYSLNGVYRLLQRHRLVPLRPRPHHRHNDEQRQQRWLDDAPLLSKACATTGRGNPSKSGSRTKPASVSRAR